MKKYLVLSALSLLIKFSYCQLPVGKDLDVGIDKMKELMASNGFTYYKTNSYEENGYIDILYKEEVYLTIGFNEFNNISTISIMTGNEEVIENIKNVVEYDKWIYDHTDTDFPKKDIYSLYDYYCALSYHPEYKDALDVGKHYVYQFLNFQ